MNQIRNFFKSLHPRQFLVALMAGVLYHVGLIGRSISLSVARLSRFYIMCI
jgi:hypothetical protein